jgi:predicted translin family RNA/ssDNA-binding protein
MENLIEQLKTNTNRMIKLSHHIGMYTQMLIYETEKNEDNEDKCDQIAAKIKSFQEDLDGLRKKWGV